MDRKRHSNWYLNGKKKLRLASACPRCHQPEEDLLHVITCPSQSKIQLRTSLLTDLTTWLKSQRTHPSISTYFIQGFKKWFCNPSTHIDFQSLITTDCLNTIQALSNQTTIGWHNSLCGFLDKTLLDLQQNHYSSINLKKTVPDGDPTLLKNSGIFCTLYGQQGTKIFMKQTKYCFFPDSKT